MSSPSSAQRCGLSVERRGPRVGRRAVVLGAAGALTAARATASGRVPVGGRLALRVPWPLASIDPHAIDDAPAAIFGPAVFETLYRRVGDAIEPALAESDPEPAGSALRVVLRAGLRASDGKPVGPRDVAASIARSRARGGRAWLVDVPAPRIDAKGALVFATRDAAALARALSSPVTAIVGAGFSPDTPVGTGALRFTRASDGARLERNPFAPLGPSFLDGVTARAAPDLAASLRAFEGGGDDIGWLGSGLHEPRAGSRPFDHGAVGWAALFTGRDALGWDAPGIAQRMCDGIPHSRLAYLGLGAAWRTDPNDGWGGPPAQLLVRDDAPWLVELARAVAATVSRPSHEVTAHPVPASELASRRASRLFALAIDLVRALDRGAIPALISLATAADPARAEPLAKRPPRLGDVPVRTLTRTLRCGVIGEVRISGGRARDVVLPASPAGLGTDWGSAYRARKP